MDDTARTRAEAYFSISRKLADEYVSTVERIRRAGLRIDRNDKRQILLAAEQLEQHNLVKFILNTRDGEWKMLLERVRDGLAKG